MTDTAELLVGTMLPLPHIGPAACGRVIDSRWSEALGQILFVRLPSGLSTDSLLLYGIDLDDALAAPRVLVAA